MKKTRINKKDMLNESMYDFYRLYDDKSGKKRLSDKIVDYYIDKIVKYGEDSLTDKEREIFNKAKINALPAEKIEYKRNKLTGDLELGNDGKPIRLSDIDDVVPGIPFITSKGRGIKKENKIEARCYWNIDEPAKYYYVFSNEFVTNENPYGITIWKTKSTNQDKVLGSFMVPKSELEMSPSELWDKMDVKFDRGIRLSKDMYDKFMTFENLYRNFKEGDEDVNKKAQTIKILYDDLVNYPK